MGTLLRIRQWQGGIEKAMVLVAAGTVLVMTALTTVDVIGRYLLNLPIPGSYEIMQMMLGGIAFFTFAFVQSRRSNITIELLTNRLPPMALAVLDLIFLVLTFAVFAVLAWQGGNQALYAWKIGEHTLGVVELPVGPARMVVPVGCGFLCLRLLTQICERVYGIVRPTETTEE